MSAELLSVFCGSRTGDEDLDDSPTFCRQEAMKRKHKAGGDCGRLTGKPECELKAVGNG